MPFAGFDNMAACESANSDKRDPGAYCSTIKRAVEGKSASYAEAFLKALEGEDTGWLDTKEWHNDRIKSAFMNDALEDLEGDRVTLEAQVLAMPPHMERGFFEWMHGRDEDNPADESKRGPPIKIGEPVGWRVKDQKVEVRWGVYGREDMGGFRESDNVSKWIDEKWEKINQGGTVSMTFLPNEWKIVNNGHAIREISRIHLQSVGYVKTLAASPGAVITGGAASKDLVIVMKALDLGPVSRETEAPTTDQIVEQLMERLEAQRTQTLKTGSKYAPGELTGMVTDEDAAKLAEDAKKATAKVKELEAELAEQKAKADLAEKQPPEGGCPEGKEWDPDAGECVDKEEMSAHEEATVTRKEFDELNHKLDEIRTLQMRTIKENMPGPEDQLKSLRDGIAAALTAGTITEEVSTSMIAIAEAAFPAEDKPFDERVTGLVKDLVDAKVAEVTVAQTKALDELEVDMREKLHLPIDETRVQPAATGAGTGGLTLEKAAGDLMEKVAGAKIPRRTGVRGGL